MTIDSAILRLADSVAGRHQQSHFALADDYDAWAGTPSRISASLPAHIAFQYFHHVVVVAFATQVPSDLTLLMAAISNSTEPKRRAKAICWSRARCWSGKISSAYCSQAA